MDVKCSKVFFDEAKKMGCDPIMSRTGHSPIKEKMKEYFLRLELMKLMKQIK